jgi:hypothetical protein
MSHFNQPPSDKLLLEAVELRIGGFKWEIIAAKLKRSVVTVRHWPMRYPERWEAAVERAEQRLTVDSNAESVVVLRNMLRDEDIKMRWHAAKTLVGLRVDLGKLALRLFAARGASGQTPNPKEDPEFQMLQFLRTRSDAELEEMAAAIRPAIEQRGAHDHPGHARDVAGFNQDSTCGDAPSAHDQHDTSPTSETPEIREKP